MHVTRRNLVKQSIGSVSLLLAARAARAPLVASARSAQTPKPPAPPASTPGVAPTSAPPVATPVVMSGSRLGLEKFEIGTSVKARSLTVVRLGSGPLAVAFVGNLHGGWEPRAHDVVDYGLAYFQANPAEVPKEISLYFVPSMNPDGYEDGRPYWATADGSGGGPDQALARTAFNANGIDLNRNFGTNWSATACGGERVRLGFDPDCFTAECLQGCSAGLAGPAPFSEPETQAYRAFILDRNIKLALTYHEGTFPSVSIREGGGGRSEPFARQLADMFAFDYLASWPDYPVTGQAQDWLDANGVVGAEIELPYRNTSAFDAAANVTAMKRAMDRVMADLSTRV
jgi:hypothetical protein